jgi:hypothetical protein
MLALRTAERTKRKREMRCIMGKGKYVALWVMSFTVGILLDRSATRVSDKIVALILEWSRFCYVRWVHIDLMVSHSQI